MKNGNVFAKFYYLLGQMPGADKEDLVWQYSNMMTNSLREFYDRNRAGFERMVKDMEDLSPSPSPQERGERAANDDCEWEEDRKRYYRSLILKAMNDYGVVVRNGDWSEVNALVLEYSKTGKILPQMSLEELKRFQRQISKILEWKKKKEAEVKRMGLCN